MTTLVRKQRRQIEKHFFGSDGRPEALRITIRHDDECGNGHNTFSITGEHFTADFQRDRSIVHAETGESLWCNSSGCIHETIAERAPELAPLIKWHLCSTDGPLHYGANVVYHALEHGPTHAWVYYTGPADPLGIGGSAERLLGYEKSIDAKKAEGQPGYHVEWDENTVKVRNLDHARSSAIWPEATDEELCSPDLAQRLAERLPALMAEFQAAVESLGLTY